MAKQQRAEYSGISGKAWKTEHFHLPYSTDLETLRLPHFDEKPEY